MSRKDQEDILDSLIISVKAKRLEEADLQKEVDRMLRMKSKYLDQTEKLQENIESLEEKKRELGRAITHLSDEHDKLMTSIIIKEEANTASEKKFIEAREYLRKERESLNNDRDAVKKELFQIKARQQKLDHSGNQLINDENRIKLDRASLNREIADFNKIKSEYKAKLDKIEVDQLAAIKNLNKSEELKKILNDRIAENKVLCDKIENESRNFTIALKRLDDDRKQLEDSFSIAKKEMNDQKEMYLAKLRLQEALDNDIEIKRLRLEKLIREKGVAKELADLERELNSR